MVTRYVNTACSPGGDGTTNNTSGATRAYATLSAWESALPDPLADSYEVLCCGSAADTTSLEITGTTTSAANYIHIRGNPTDPNGQSFLARYSTSHYRLEASVAFGEVLLVSEPYVRITGIQLKNTASSPRAVVYFNTGVASGGSDDCRVDSVFAWHEGTSYDRNCFIQLGSIVRWTNCIGRVGSAGSAFIASFGGGGAANMKAYNCVGIGGDYAIRNSSGANVVEWKNCYAANSVTADYSANGATLTTCRSEDGSESTTTAAYSTSSGCYFTNVTGGSEDFQIGASSALIDVGTDLSGTFTNDIAGTTRSGTWDVGVWEYSSVTWSSPVYWSSGGRFTTSTPSGFTPSGSV